MIPVAREIGKGRSMKVKEIMTTRVVTVTPDTPVPVIASLLRDNRISGVPVVDAGGAVVGLVSEYDLLAREGETAGGVMTGSVITVSEDTDVEDVRHLLVERRIRRGAGRQQAAAGRDRQPQRRGGAAYDGVGVPGMR